MLPPSLENAVCHTNLFLGQKESGIRQGFLEMRHLSRDLKDKEPAWQRTRKVIPCKGNKAKVLE